ncbi:ankyrin repeat-containing protein ITN1-like isoform X2 [Ipomoea triloba]|uniref:ankyrin repeat-containing protein ITN1-like isoform X2 n=1 Tax=Ipomoea triloba TaxID=35885 RepID=UPI00125DD88B|nr:ankyrin repeat-containing protein ITN1-like isoform X2 [Ipomoea triloba]
MDTLRSDAEKHEYNKKFYKALMGQKKEEVIELCKHVPEGPLHVVTLHGDTVLHLAAYSKQRDLAKCLLEQVSKCDGAERLLQRANSLHYTVFHEAATSNKAVPLAKEMLRLSPGLLHLRGDNNETALFRSVRYGKREMFDFLDKEVGKAVEGDQEKWDAFHYRSDRSTTLHQSVLMEHFAPKFISIPLLDHIRMKFDKYESALKLAKFLIAKDTSWESTEAVKNKSETRFHKYGHLFQEQKPDDGERMQSGAKRCPETPLFLATKSGCIEIVQEILEAYPQAVEYVDEKGRMILHVAIKYCQTQIFRLVQSMKLPRKRLKRKVTNEGNSILHMVGLKDKEVLGDMRSPALLLQERLLFFEMVKSICKADMVKLLNSEGHTAEEVFNCTHAQLRSDAKDWLKRTAENCTIVAVLISTVAFAAAYTIPGGPNQSTGYPVLLHKTFFVVFTIADVLSITLALTSTITFLAILTSPFHMKDFKRSLPQKLMLGLSLLILSVTMMMLAFAATVILMISNKERWTKIALSCMSFIPVTIFAVSYVPLYISLWKNYSYTFRKLWDALPRLNISSGARSNIAGVSSSSAFSVSKTQGFDSLV